MSKFPAKDRSSIPLIQNNNLSYNGITTRLMEARKQSLLSQLQKDRAETTTQRSSITEKPKFLSGTSIPNSTIRLHLLPSLSVESNEKVVPVAAHSSASLVQESDESKSKVDSEQRGLERMRQKIRQSSIKSVPNVDKNQERRRSSSIKNLEGTFHQNKRRRCTLESIKDAIDKSPNHVTKLVNADSIERRNIGQHFRVSDWTVVAKDVNRLDPVLEKTTIKEGPQKQTNFLIANLTPLK